MAEHSASAAAEGRSVGGTARPEGRGTTGENETEASKPVRRRAFRAAGPASGTAPSATGVSVEASKPVKVRISRPGPPPRRQPHRALVTVVALASVFIATAVTGLFAWLAFGSNRQMEAAAARKQQFVDTASQTVVNMFSYNQNSIDESVNRFVNGTSGPLRDMMSQGNNVDNLKAIFRDTNASSEAVINGAALEGKIDEVAKNAAVLVSVRVTVTNLDGVNSPSQPYRLRVIVHEDDNGHMTAYDLKYPDGGN
jgi:Mce-associated membrane protein